MDAISAAAVEAFVSNVLRPDGDVTKIPFADHATFAGPMVEHLEREEILWAFGSDEMRQMFGSVPVIERTDGERFSTITIELSSPDDNPAPLVAHFVLDVSGGQIVAVQMAFNSFRYPADRREVRTAQAREWRAARDSV